MAVRLSALRAGLPLPPGSFLVLISVSRPQGHIAAGRIRSIENYQVRNFQNSILVSLIYWQYAYHAKVHR
jgi:hypothetical protein